MLSYAYQVLGERGYANYKYDEFDNVENLLAQILDLGVRNEIKRGVYKDYTVTFDEQSRTIRGKINLAQTITNYSSSKQTVSCEFDEYAEDNSINRVLKATMVYELHSSSLDNRIKKSFKQNLTRYSSVKIIDVGQIRWNSLRFDRNNATYRMLTNICYLLINGLLPQEEKDGIRLAKYVDSQKMHALYERFIRAYYKKHFPMLSPAATHIEWKSDGYIDFLPEMRSDIMMSYNHRKLIIDAKYYGSMMQTGQFGKKAWHSSNLYQLFTYVHNADDEDNHSVNGMLLYAKTDEQITPDNNYSLDGYPIHVKSLDLNCDFSQIREQLDGIVYDWLGSDSSLISRQQ